MNSDVTRLLEQWRGGDKDALDRLIPIVHARLHQIAKRCMAGERQGHSMQATVLVNEAYVKLVGGAQKVNWQNRTHFLAVAAGTMRRILVDHARAKGYQKRGGGAQRVPFITDEIQIPVEPGRDIEALDDALKALAQIDERKSQVVEMKYFGGLTVEEIATVLKVSPETVMRDWRLAKAWLLRELTSGHDRKKADEPEARKAGRPGGKKA